MEGATHAAAPAGGRDKLSMSLDDIIKTSRKTGGKKSSAAAGAAKPPTRGGKQRGGKTRTVPGGPASRRRKAHAASISARQSGFGREHHGAPARRDGAGGTLHVTISNERAYGGRTHGRDSGRGRGRDSGSGRGHHVRRDGTRLPY